MKKDIEQVVWDFDVPLFRQKVYLVVGGSPEALESQIEKIHGTYNVIELGVRRGQDVHVFPDTAGKGFKVEGLKEPKIAFWLWLKNSNTRLENISMLSHEATHVAAEILRHIGVRFSEDSEEVYAYLQEEIFYEALRRMKS